MAAQCSVRSRRRTQVRTERRRVLVLEGQHQGVPSRADVADAPAVLEEHGTVEGDVRALTGDSEDGLGLETFGPQRHQERREASVALTGRVGSDEQEDVVGQVAVRREHLLSVNDPSASTASGPGLYGGNVRARFGLAHPEGDDQFAPHHFGQDVRLHLLEPTAAMTRATIMEVDTAIVGASALVNSSNRTCTPRGRWPRIRHGAIRERSNCARPGRARNFRRAQHPRCRALLQRGRKVLGQERPDLFAQRLDFGIPGEVHQPAPPDTES